MPPMGTRSRFTSSPAIVVAADTRAATAAEPSSAPGPFARTQSEAGARGTRSRTRCWRKCRRTSRSVEADGSVTRAAPGRRARSTEEQDFKLVSSRRSQQTRTRNGASILVRPAVPDTGPAEAEWNSGSISSIRSSSAVNRCNKHLLCAAQLCGSDARTAQGGRTYHRQHQRRRLSAHTD